MLGAGHHYSTAGKGFGELKEYEFNRTVANYAKDMLNDYENVTVYFAHNDSRDVPLQERTDKANELDVDVFVDIHANAYGTTWNNAEGIETYVYHSKPKEAMSLAAYTQNHLIRETGRRNRGVKTANFHVLRETGMTAILVECGFMTNKEENYLLRTEDYRKKCATAIVKGLVDQYKLKKRSTPKPAPKPAPTTKPSAGSFDKKIHRVLVDGKQLGAYDNAVSIGEFAENYAKSGAKKIVIELI